MHFFRSFGMLGVAIAPLVILTLSTFFRGPSSAVGEWVPPVLEEIEKVRRNADTERLRLADGGTAAAVDPAGFSIEGEPEGDLALPYELAERLAAGERARHADDLEAAESARKGLERIVADRLTAIEKIRPNGAALAANVKRRLDEATRRCTWLTNRQSAGRELRAAEDAMLAGPEGDGETKCLQTIKELRKQLPKSAESIADEPGDALTPDELARAGALVLRATFRRDFFKARQAAHAEGASSRELEQLQAEWNAFFVKYGKSGPPDVRDKSLLDEAQSLQRQSRLGLLRATAREQSTGVDLAERVAIWIKQAAATNPAELGSERKAARTLVQKWLEQKAASLPPLPKSVPGVQEGFTETKRLIGFFERVKSTPSQYRWWAWNTTDKQRKELNKGEKQINLKSPPAPPQHEKFAADYAESRKAFLDRGFTTSVGTVQFQVDCDRLASEFESYRQQWDGAVFPADKVSANWAEVFAAGRKVAEELLVAGEKHGLWDSLRSGDEN